VCGVNTKNQIGAKQDVDVVSVYYDTPTRALWRNGVSFRLRRHGQKYLQTVKADTGSLARRKEWECEVPSNKPDFKALGGTTLEPLLKKKKVRKAASTFVRDACAARRHSYRQGAKPKLKSVSIVDNTLIGISIGVACKWVASFVIFGIIGEQMR